MPNPTRRGHAVWGNSLDPNQRATAIPDDDPPLSAQETQKLFADLFRRKHQGYPPTREQIARLRDGLARHRPPSTAWPVPVVYYFRVGNRIKIGHTVNVENRANSVGAEEVLGWEPGDRALEVKRHKQFDRYRTHGEWFEDCEAIRAHIATLGEPA